MASLHDKGGNCAGWGAAREDEAAGTMHKGMVGGGKVWASKGQPRGHEATALQNDSVGRDIRRGAAGLPRGRGLFPASKADTSSFSLRVRSVSHVRRSDTQAYGMIWQ